MTMTRLDDRRGFTLVELIVVIGMLMLLAGAVSTSVAGAHRRAKIQQATTEAQEMTKAILAYENYGKGYSLDAHIMESPTEATEDSLGFILGKENRQNGQTGKMPILFNASVTRSKRILDPWGNPYYVTIRKGTVDQEQDKTDGNVTSYVTFPNYNRRPADEITTGNNQK
ncbi:MAG: type II secretion system protein [bacterium]|nr:type II secretion system protein [bacterium]